MARKAALERMESCDAKHRVLMQLGRHLKSVDGCEWFIPRYFSRAFVAVSGPVQGSDAADFA